uniref:Uncharacterized protein n=1 Tax=viral metagenome TaxID=1070528 RepID=A0A6C0IWZ7_9ZZZZ
MPKVTEYVYDISKQKMFTVKLANTKYLRDKYNTKLFTCDECQEPLHVQYFTVVTCIVPVVFLKLLYPMGFLFSQ